MSLDALSLIVQELQKYQGLREFFCRAKASLSIQYSVLLAASSNTIQRLLSVRGNDTTWKLGSASWPTSETYLKNC